MLVVKFGGTSVGDASRILNAAGLAIDAAAHGRSGRGHLGMSGVTNELIRAAHLAAQGDWQPEFATSSSRAIRASPTVTPTILRAIARWSTLVERLDRFELFRALDGAS
jgi:aspartokinase